MAATIRDMSRRGDQGLPIVDVAALVDGHLASWITAANAQNTAQLLTLIANSLQAPGFAGWTVQARITAQNAGQPVDLMSQWVLNLATGGVTAHAGLAAGRDPGGGLGAHGVLSGGRGSTNTLMSLTIPYPLAAVAAWSLTPGQEFFAFAWSQHNLSSRQALALLIAKDVTTGDWHLSNTDMAGVVNTAAWSRNLPQLMLASSFRLESFSGTTVSLLTRPAQWQPIVPGIIFTTPLAPVQWWDPVVLPVDLAQYHRSGANLGYFRAGDGSEWLQLGPARLAVRAVDPTT